MKLGGTIKLLMCFFIVSLIANVSCTKIKIGVLMPQNVMSTLTLFKGAMDTAAKRVLSDPQFVQVTNITEVEFIHLNTKTSRPLTMALAEQLIDSGAVAGIGELNSPNTEVAAMYFSNAKKPFCSGGATSTSLSNKSEFPYFFRTINSDIINARAAMDFVHEMGWRKIAILSSNDIFGQGLASEASTRCKQKNITVLTALSFSRDQIDFSNQIGIIKKSGAKVIYLPASLFLDVVSFLKAAKNEGMLTPEYVYILVESAILVRVLSRSNDSSLIQGIIYASARDTFYGLPEYDQYMASWNNQSLQINPNATPPADPIYGAFYHDCIISILYGFMKAMLKTGATITNLFDGSLSGNLTYPAYNHSEIKGATGSLKLEPNGDRIGSVSIRFWHNTTGLQTAYYWAEDKLTNVTNIVFRDGSTNIPPDSDPDKPEFYIKKSDAIGIVAIVFTIIQLILCFVVIIILTLYRNNMVIRSSSYFFCLVIILGCIIGALSVFVNLERPTDQTCMARPWLMSIGFCLVFSNLTGKTWRIYKIFSNENLKVITLTNGQLLIYTSSGLVIQLVLLIIWTVHDPLVPFVDSVSDPNYQLVICKSKNETFQKGIEWTLIGFNLLLTIIGGYFAIRTRHVDSNYKESKYIGLAIYNIYVLSMVVLPIEYSNGTSASVKFLVLLFGILMISTFSLLVLFVPKILLMIYKVKGNTADSNTASKKEKATNSSRERERKASGQPSGKLEMAVKELSVSNPQ